MLRPPPPIDRPRQEALFKAMACPDFYPHPVSYVRQKETHISMVFLTGEDVYKIKKNVDLGFLDFSSLAKRRRYCELEVRLNRRLSHQVYRGVIPITYAHNRFRLSGSGPAVEVAVHMRQLPEACSLGALLDQDRITIEQIQRLATRLADFFTQQGRISPQQAAAAWENVKAACEENFRQTQSAVGQPLDAQRYQTVRAATFFFLARRKGLFHRRRQSGKIYDGHGDLRAAHIYYTGPRRIQIIDCIEFNPRLRHIDIGSDLAFLMMDLDVRGASALGTALLEAYVRRTGDWPVYALMPFYKCYRAMVRCKVNCIRMHENHCGDGGLMALQRSASRYLTFAHRYAAHFTRPTAWVLCGLPGSGKSSIARILAEELVLATLRSDVIRKQLFRPTPPAKAAAGGGCDRYSPAAHRWTYDELLRRARQALRQKQSIILDATFSRPGDRRQVVQMAKDLRSRAVFVECTAPDAVLKARLMQREGTPSVSDARPHHLEMLKQRYLPGGARDPTMHLQIDTTRPIQACLRAILAWDYRASLMPVAKEKTASPVWGPRR